jgi:hypothetical protein
MTDVAPTFEERIDQKIRMLEAEMALCLNYVRAIAMAHLPTETIRMLEDEFEARVKREKQ